MGRAAYRLKREGDVALVHAEEKYYVLRSEDVRLNTAQWNAELAQRAKHLLFYEQRRRALQALYLRLRTDADISIDHQARLASHPETPALRPRESEAGRSDRATRTNPVNSVDVYEEEEMKHRKSVTARTAAAFVFALTLSSVGAQTAAVRAAEPEPNDPSHALPQVRGQIEFFTAKSSNQLRGWYNHAGSVVFFHTNGFAGGKSAAENTTPDVVTVHLEVNGAAIDATVDHNAGVVVFNGHGTMLYPEDVQVLDGFYPALENALFEPLVANSKGVTQNLALSRSADALHRLATMLSEAPAGLVLGERTIERPAKPTTSPSESHEPPVFGRGAFSQQDTGSSAKHCQREGEQSITYLYSPCGWRNNYEYHDATNHCYQGYSRYYGSTTPNCVGRCGAGCGWYGGSGAYTHDCHDHDWCVRFHTEAGAADPGHPSCGDEFWDADDDFWWARWSC